MGSKICVVCNTEESIDTFSNKYKKCKRCNNKRSLSRYYENKDKISNCQKIYYEKK